MVRAVTVDWWHTLAEPHGGDWEASAKRTRVEGVRRVLREHGIECTTERLDVAYDIWTDHLRRVWLRGVDWSSDEQVLELLASAGYDGVANDALIADLGPPIGEALLTHPPRIHDGALEALDALRTEGYRLGIISNTGRTWGRFLREVQARAGLGDLFEVRTFSDEARVRKPARAIFDRTLEALRLNPEDVVHVGDDVEADVAGAKGAGMGAIWYDTGFWKGAVAEGANAVIRHWRELPDAIRGL